MSETRWCDVGNHPFPVPSKGSVRMQAKYEDELPDGRTVARVKDMDACGDHAILFSKPADPAQLLSAEIEAP